MVNIQKEAEGNLSFSFNACLLCMSLNLLLSLYLSFHYLRDFVSEFRSLAVKHERSGRVASEESVKSLPHLI